MTAEQKQCLLKYLGYYTGTVDDIWGNLSRQATEAFQRDFLEPAQVDGIFGPITEERILEVIASGEKAPVQTVPDPDTDDLFWDHIRYWTREEFRCRCWEYNEEPLCDGFPVEPDRTLVELVDDIRHKAGRPGHRSSGIRCPRHNANSKGVKDSRHLSGKALDFYIEGLSGRELLALAKADPRTRYAYIIDGSYVHVDVA